MRRNIVSITENKSYVADFLVIFWFTALAQMGKNSSFFIPFKIVGAIPVWLSQNLDRQAAKLFLKLGEYHYFAQGELLWLAFLLTYWS